MDLFEYQGKQLFARYGIPVSAGEAAETVDDAVAAAERVGYPGRRQGAGAGRRARQGRRREARRRTPTRCARTPATSSASTSRATSCSVVWVEHASDIAEEYYASFTLDRSAKKYLGMLSRAGRRRDRDGRRGEPRRDRAHRRRSGRRARAKRRAARGSRPAKLNPQATDGAVDILMKLYNAYVDGDADLVEINPLILTPDGQGARARREGRRSTTTRGSVIPSGTSSPGSRSSTRASAKRRRRACSTSASTATSA